MKYISITRREMTSYNVLIELTDETRYLLKETDGDILGDLCRAKEDTWLDAEDQEFEVEEVEL